MKRVWLPTFLLLLLTAGGRGTFAAPPDLPPLPVPKDVVRAAPAPDYAAVPLAEDDVLVFPPDEEAVLTVKAMNRSGKDARLVAAVREFKGVPVKRNDRAAAVNQGETVVAYGVRAFYRIETFPEKTVGRGEATVRAGTDGPVRIRLGKLPKGFYMVDLTFFRGDKPLRNRKYPLGVFRIPEKTGEIEPPAFPVGVYGRFMQYRRTEPPIFWKTYVHAVAHDLREHHINAFVAVGGFNDEELAIYNRYGIVGISRGGRYLDHPGVIASFIGDEPKPGKELEKLKEIYDRLREKTDKAITTCMVGDGIGLTTPADPVNLWKVLRPKVRVFRWYGIKKHFYGVLHHIHYKGRLALPSILRIVEVSADTPWWIVLPAFGGDQHEAYFQNPSPAQIRSMTHLALAYGADGLVYFQYQTGLVDSVTLKPRDGKLAALGEVAGLVAAHADELNALKHTGLDIRCPSPVVQAVPVRIGEQNAVYAVNKDPVNAVSTRLMLWDEVWHWSKAHDVYADKDLEIKKDDEGYLFAQIHLRPGEGKLIVTDANVDKR